MLISMTGYGASSYSDDNLSINIEVKTLNSKFLDLNFRLPKSFSEKEIEIRNIVSEKLQRGKVMLNIDYVNEQDTTLKQRYNEELFTRYYQNLRNLADKVVASDSELFKIALSAPDVIINDQKEEISDQEWDKLRSLIVQAIEQCDSFRRREGAELQQKLESYISTIAEHLEAVASLDPERVERIRTRIKNNLSKFVEEESLDKNRLEQELVYYIEKLDITEEKVRLKSHLDHFTEVLSDENSLGKKLGFISQEMGREINTIGSKANDAGIQKHVVTMKEELEKIKEQVLNIL
ncbi:YicC/YloC family endoribonuclease [Fulvivirga sediminis]|uniref:YicC family protein n=1 Tax=Fulvivirga sediminis TaxID=2803949 RepID=A0A937F9H7_9BACT|nr:YicC/YloC family endoribonuclease [Fulvivirga sediminis]MBL3657089.1 YicC family protein [Fulvivirga sediminis]